jgi:hypothetical protein
MSSKFKFLRARAIALAAGVAVLGSLTMASSALATQPLGTACQLGANRDASGNLVATADAQNNGKISGRGSTFQKNALGILINAYSNDFCGAVDSAEANDPAKAATFSSTIPAWLGPNNTTMIAYDYSNASTVTTGQSAQNVGSGGGIGAMACRSDAFAGSDIPYDTPQLTALNGAITGTTPLPAGSTFAGGSCDSGLFMGTTATGFSPPYTPVRATGFGGSVTVRYPAGPDGTNQAASMMSFPVAGGAAAIGVHLTTCGNVGTPPANPPTTLQFSISTLSNILNGTDKTWGDADIVADNPGLGGCTTPIRRVVRACIPSDDRGAMGTPVGTGGCIDPLSGSGTSFSVKTFLNDDVSTAAGCDGVTWGTLSSNAKNAQWNDSATMGACSPIVRSCATGGSALITAAINTSSGTADSDTNTSTTNCTGGNDFTTSPSIPVCGANGAWGTADPSCPAGAEPVNGQVGYADLADWKNKTSTTVILASVQTHDDFVANPAPGHAGEVYVSPGSPTTNSNCNMNAKGLPGGATPTATTAVGLGSGAGNTWAVDDTGKSYDVTNSGGNYPVCALTWDFVYTKLNGFGVPASSLVSGAQSFAGPGTATGLSLGNFNLTNTKVLAPGSVTYAAGGAPTGETPSVTSDGTLPLPNGTSTIGGTGTVSASVTDPTGCPGGVSPCTVTETINWTGITANMLTGVTCTTCTSTTATNFAFADHAVVSFANIKDSGGPVQGLNENQRRTLYTLFGYVFTPAAQAKLNNTGYDQLPAAWLATLRSGFTTNF